jgi:hypothetical protein
MTTRQKAFNLCVEFLKTSVIRGERVEEIARGMMGHYDRKDSVHVGGYARPVGWRIDSGKPLLKLKPNTMAVEQVGGVECCEVFTLSEIKEEIEKRWIPETAKIRSSRESRRTQ